jgi:hypothetical protein
LKQELYRVHLWAHLRKQIPVSDDYGCGVEAIEAIKALDKAGAPAFITVGNDPPCVMCQFKDLVQAQEFHRALIQAGLAARFIEAVEKGERR